jgi:hypothetical protein
MPECCLKSLAHSAKYLTFLSVLIFLNSNRVIKNRNEGSKINDGLSEKKPSHVWESIKVALNYESKHQKICNSEKTRLTLISCS